MTPFSQRNAFALAFGLAAACLPLSAQTCPTFEPIRAEFISETAGASHMLGYFFLDIDTNGDGIPNFAQCGPDDDLDGDGIANQYDDDDDNDGILDVDDHTGYYQASGAAAGEAPNPMPASVFAYGELAAQSGHHPNDYWQFVPNGFTEQKGYPYQDNQGNSYPGIFRHAGAYLYVDRNANAVPDFMEVRHPSNTAVPAFALDRGFTTEDIVSQTTVPGVLGAWDGQVVGETLFYLMDDDGGTTSHSSYSDFNPYRGDTSLGTISDFVSNTDGNLDYPIYTTMDANSPAVPTALKEADPRGVPRFWYSRIGAPAANTREVVMFLTVFYPSFGNTVNTYYSKTAFNEALRYPNQSTNNATTGDAFGGGSCNRLNWFPAYRNTSDHNRVAACAFGNNATWSDIATIPAPYERPLAHDPVNQDWVDQWQNWHQATRVYNYFNLGDWLRNTNVDAAQLVFERYGVDLAADAWSQVVRAVDDRAPHFVTWDVEGLRDNQIFRGTLIGIEDLNGNSTDRDLEDVVFMLNRPLAGEPLDLE